VRCSRSGIKHLPLLLSIAAVTTATLIAGVIRAKDKCSPTCVALHGPFTSMSGEPCASPIGMCTHGLLVGDFPSRYDFTFLTLQSANDPQDPTKFVYTGASVITPKDGSGVMYGEDTGVIHIPEDGSPAPFVTKVIIERGTRRYSHTQGGFVATGSLAFDTGDAVGSYSAVLCPADRNR
jgi:hypothetical protein